MKMINITDLRRNAKDVLAEVVGTKKPIVILQRSKPVAYLIDADSYNAMQQEEEDFTEKRRRVLKNIFQLQEKVATRIGRQEDSTQLIRDMREGLSRDE